MSDFKLDVVVRHDSMKSESSSADGEVELGESNNESHMMRNDTQKQGRAISSVTNAVRRALGVRFFRGNRAEVNDKDSLPVHGDEKREHGSAAKSGPLVSGIAYCLSSCSMILLNKIVLSGYNFDAGISLMFYQNLISVVVVVVMGLCGAISVERLNWKLIKTWTPVNLIFVGMLVSGMYSTWRIVYISKCQNQKVWTAMLLMIISAVSSGITDLTFDTTGYAWQIANCILTASYSLTLRLVMDKAKQLTRSGALNEFSMVLLNNLLSLPFAIFLILIFDEWKYVMSTDVVQLPMFWVVATASGLLGLSISFTSMWFLKQTGPTTYSLVGSLNKIPISIAGLVLFKVPSVCQTYSAFFLVCLLEYSLPKPRCPDSDNPRRVCLENTQFRSYAHLQFWDKITPINLRILTTVEEVLKQTEVL